MAPGTFAKRIRRDPTALMRGDYSVLKSKNYHSELKLPNSSLVETGKRISQGVKRFA